MDVLVLAVAMGLGATAALLAVRISLAYSKSMSENSANVAAETLRLGTAALEQADKTREETRAVQELSEQVQKMDVTVARFAAMVLSANPGTGITRGAQAPRQHGEGLPGTIRGPMIPPPPPLPPEGLAADPPSDTKAPSVGAQVRARAFAEPT